MRRRQLVVLVPVCLSSSVGSTLAKASVLGVFGLGIGLLGGNRGNGWGVKLSKTSISNSRIALDWVLSSLDSRSLVSLFDLSLGLCRRCLGESGCLDIGNYSYKLALEVSIYWGPLTGYRESLANN